MSRLKKTLFISDVHLDENCTKSHQRLLNLLQHIDSTQIDTLYILGDLFEVWIGDDDSTLFHQSIIDSLASIKRKGVKTYFIRGNRDFLIGEKFMLAAGCELLPDHQVISLYGEPVLIMHGDTLCTHDYGYIRARRILRNKFFKRFYLRLSLTLRRLIANKLRAKSKRYTQSVSSAIMDVTDAKVIEMMEYHEVKYLIHGHTHRPKIHELLINNGKANRIVLGAWHEKGNVLVWDEFGRKSLIYFDDSEDFEFLSQAF